MHHVILGEGYAHENDIQWIITNDPYGKISDSNKGETYNNCGDNTTY